MKILAYIGLFASGLAISGIVKNELVFWSLIVIMINIFCTYLNLKHLKNY